MSNGRIQYERKAAGKLILKHFCIKTVHSYSKKNAFSVFFKGDRGGRVDDFGTQEVAKFRSLVKTGNFFDVSSTKRQTI